MAPGSAAGDGAESSDIVADGKWRSSRVGARAGTEREEIDSVEGRVGLSVARRASIKSTLTMAGARLAGGAHRARSTAMNDTAKPFPISEAIVAQT